MKAMKWWNWCISTNPYKTEPCELQNLIPLVKKKSSDVFVNGGLGETQKNSKSSKY